MSKRDRAQLEKEAERQEADDRRWADLAPRPDERPGGRHAEAAAERAKGQERMRAYV